MRTAEIAEKIGQVLRQAGLRTDVLPADRVSRPDLLQGSCIGQRGLHRQVAQRGSKASCRPTRKRWLNGRCGCFRADRRAREIRLELVKGWRFPQAQQPIADRIQPCGIAVFHGNVNMKKLNFIEKWMVKNVQTPIGDFRDWEAITSWATAIADVLKEKDLASGTLSEQ